MESLTAAHAIALVAHLLLFVYWLGGDLGVFYSSRFVVDPGRSREARLTAAKIMLDLDLIPRICMSLTLTVGGILNEFYGIPHPPWQQANSSEITWRRCQVAPPSEESRYMPKAP